MKFVLVGGLIAFAACTSDPYAPVNQSTPIRQMDNAFEGRPLNAPPPSYYSQSPYGRPYKY